MTDERAMEVTQADRELAAHCAVLAEMKEMIRSGCCDDMWVVQEAAKHRTNAVQARDAEICAWHKEQATWHDKHDDGLSGFDRIAQAHHECADAIERGDV